LTAKYLKVKRWKNIERRAETFVGEFVSHYGTKTQILKTVMHKLKKFCNDKAPSGEYMIVLIAAALFISFRNDPHSDRFEIKEIARKADCTLGELVRVYDTMKKKLGIYVPTQKPHMFIDRMLNYLEIPSLKTKATKTMAKIREVVQRTQKLLDVAIEALILEGRQAKPLAIAALQIVCNAYNIGLRKHIMKDLKVFSGTVTQRREEILAHLAEMAVALPLNIRDQKGVHEHLPFLITELEMLQDVYLATEVTRKALGVALKRKRAELGAYEEFPDSAIERYKEPDRGEGDENIGEAGGEKRSEEERKRMEGGEEGAGRKTTDIVVIEATTSTESIESENLEDKEARRQQAILDAVAQDPAPPPKKRRLRIPKRYARG